jgi:hypothetical protein
MALRLVLALLLSLPAAPARSDTAGAGVLPMVGARAAVLNPALGRAVAERGYQALLGPLEVRTRLAADDEIAGRLRRAREAIALAREHELQMNREAAARAAMRAIRELEAARAPFFDQRLVARAYATLALTLLLRPANPASARKAFRRALAVDPGYRPGEGQLAPKVIELLDEERRARPAVRPPAAGDLAWLAQRLRLSRLVWLHVSAEGAVKLLVHDEGKLRTVARTVDPDDTLPAIARLVGKTIGSANVATRTDAPWPSTPPPPPPPEGSPWYGKWWVWAIVGAVVAGTAISVGVAVSQQPEPPAEQGPYDFRFHF